MSRSSYNIRLSGIWRFLFGKNRPVLITRILCFLALGVFVWFFAWYLLNLIALQLIDTMPNAAQLKQVFYDIGERTGNNTILQSCTNMAFSGLVGCIMILIAVTMIWREKKTGYWVLFIGLFLVTFSPALFIGVNYLAKEQLWWEYILPGFVICFGIVEQLITRKANS